MKICRTTIDEEDYNLIKIKKLKKQLQPYKEMECSTRYSQQLQRELDKLEAIVKAKENKKTMKNQSTVVVDQSAT